MRPAQNGCSATGEHRDDPGEPRIAVCCSARLSSIPVNEVMRGSPITRTTSADGRWAYALYDGAGKTPFVHALDTRKGRARCIDLPIVEGRGDLWTLRLRLTAGATLALGNARQTVALIDRKSFRVSAPAAASTSEGPARRGGVTPRARRSPRPFRVCRAHPRAQAFANRRERGCSRSPRESSRAPVQSGVGAPAGLFDCRG